MSCCEAGLGQTSRPDRARAVPGLAEQADGTEQLRQAPARSYLLPIAGFQVHQTATHITDDQIEVAVGIEITGGWRRERGYFR